MTGNEVVIEENDKVNDNLEINHQNVHLEKNKDWSVGVMVSDQIDVKNVSENNNIKINSIATKFTSDCHNKIVNLDSIQLRVFPIIHSAVEKPVCNENSHDPNFLEYKGLDCEACLELIHEPSISIPQLFAFMRDWCPGTQRHMDKLVDEMFKRGAHVDDVDSLEGNTMLHYACKSASDGLGFSDKAPQLVHMLLQRGANYKLRSRWTDMSALHYAAYFDCPEILELLLGASKDKDIDARCKEYHQGTALHIAASGLCLRAATFLMERGADATLVNNKFQRPYECIAHGVYKDKLDQNKAILDELRNLLKDPVSKEASKILNEMGIIIGEEVIVGGDKMGVLRFCGKTEFGNGVWCGVELNDKQGTNCGTVAGVAYFQCKPGHGMFAPPSKISPFEASQTKRPSIDNGGSKNTPKFHIGDRVSVKGYKLGFIRYIGKVKYAGGLWIGVELDKPYGKCDGSVNNVKYFSCKPQHGVLVTPDKVKREKQDAVGPGGRKPAPNSRVISGNLLSTPGNPGNIGNHGNIGNLSFDSNRSAVCSSPMKATPAIRSAISTPNVNKMVSTCSPIKARGVVRSNSGGPARVTSPGPRLSPSRSKNNLSNSSSTDDIYKQQIKLQPGMNAFVNGEIGTVKFVGRVDFSEGIWIGIILKNPNGKNDGTVQGKKYFICKPGYGLMVRPSKVSIHGINASKLIDDNDYPA